jgi:hypothetical protein
MPARQQAAGGLLDSYAAENYTWFYCSACATGMNAAHAFAAHRNGQKCMSRRSVRDFDPLTVTRASSYAWEDDCIVIKYATDCPMARLLETMTCNFEGIPEAVVVDGLEAMGPALGRDNKGSLAEALHRMDHNRGKFFTITTDRDVAAQSTEADRMWRLDARVVFLDACPPSPPKQQATWCVEEGGSEAAGKESASSTASKTAAPEPLREACRMRGNCNCKNIAHFVWYSHPDESAMVRSLDAYASLAELMTSIGWRDDRE